MADEILESGQQAGSGGTTNSGVSQTADVKQTSTFDAETLLTQLKETIKEEVGRTVQSTKDKRFSEIEKKMGDFQPVLERVGELMKGGKSFDEAQKEIEWEEMRKAVFGKEQTQTSEPVSAGNTQAPAVNSAQAFQNVGLDLKDPRVAVALQTQYKTDDAAELAAYRLLKTIQASPTPTDAQGTALQGKPPAPQDASGLKQEYIKEVQVARGNKSLIKGIQAKYQNLGVDTGSVDFRP